MLIIMIITTIIIYIIVIIYSNINYNFLNTYSWHDYYNYYYHKTDQNYYLYGKIFNYNL